MESSSSSITFADLMKECHIDDVVEFGKLLRNNHLPQVSSKKLVDSDVADEIVKRLTGRRIDWYKYKILERDLTDQGPLERVSDELIKRNIEQWYQRIITDHQPTADRQDHILGLVCRGGFLEGSDNSDYLVRFDPSINVLIGDRGAGKSTILNLCGLLGTSVSEETDILVDRLLNLFRSTPHNINSDSRRVRQLLYKYGITMYASFFIRSHGVFCYYVNLKSRIHDLLEYRERAWMPVPSIDDSIGPAMLVLEQGEVIRISEARNEFYLNNILDGLFPDLYARRTEFARTVTRLVAQFEHYSRFYLEFNPVPVTRFIDRCAKELGILSRYIQEGRQEEETIQILKGYLSEARKIKSRGTQISIFELLHGDESSFFYLYIGRISGFLHRSIEQIELMRRERLNRWQEESLGDTGLRQDGIENTNYEEVLGEIVADKEALRIHHLLETEGASSREDNQTKKERDLFLDAIDELSHESTNDAWSNIWQQVFDFLQTRLRVFRNWVDIYAERRPHLDSALVSLLGKYSTLLDDRVHLIEAQEKKCSFITDALNKDNLEIRVFTKRASDDITKHMADIGQLNNIGNVYSQLMKAVPNARLDELYRLSSSYDETILNAFRILRKLEKEVIEPQNEFLFNPIEIELRQGNAYTIFHRLSFGQKSGIILKMALAATEKRVIIIDQPEDNLDANSVVNMLVPTLSRLGGDRQVIVATHNSNLVMGLNASNLIVLESLGDSGRINVQGSLAQKRVVKETLDVLEGGVSTFELKLRIYEDFISRVTGQIQDIDIMAIESSFRRRTIDGLRNFLQPVVSDRSLMDFARHELKQRDATRLRAEVMNTRNSIEKVQKDPDGNLNEVLQQFTDLCNHLDHHIKRLQDAIEEIRLMDTQAKPQFVDPYDVLSNLKSDYMSRASAVRQIRIEIDDSIRGKSIYVDRDHLVLVFRNLISNSLRATEKRTIADWSSGQKVGLAESVTISLVGISERHVILAYTDNGCGMSPEIRRKLYFEPCSDQRGRDHGLGGVIIRKLLDLNGSSIRILESDQNCQGTVQEILLNTVVPRLERNVSSASDRVGR